MLPFRSGAAGKLGVSAAIFLLALSSWSAPAAEPKPKSNKPKNKQKGTAGPKDSPPPVSGIPLPIGHEIKGLVLPDFDREGHLRSRFEAGTAKRLDAERIEFGSLKVISFNQQNEIDLQMEVPVSTFELDSRMLRSNQRTTITRADFTISGDALDFNTIERQGTLKGNVKMVITNRSMLEGNRPK